MVSSVSDGLLRDVIVLLLTGVYKFDSIRVLSPSGRFLSLLIGHEGFNLIDIISDFSICESQMVSLVESSIGGGHQVGQGQEEQLRHVENVEELSTVAHVEPHPVTVGLQTD